MGEFLDINQSRVLFGDACIVIHHIKWHYGDFPEQNSVPHKHQYYELHSVVNGGGTLVFHDREVNLQPGEAVIISPNTPHMAMRLTGDKAEDLTLSFSLEQMEGEQAAYTYFLETLNEFSGSLRVFSPHPEFISDIRLISRLTNASGLREFCYVKTAGYRMVFSLFDSLNQFRENKIVYRKSYTPPSSQSETLDRGRLELLLGNLVNETSLTLDQISGRLGYSNRQTQRLIVKTYGKPFRELRQDMLFSTACQLLREAPEMSVSEIRKRAGFSKNAVMKRVFLERCGMTPEEFRVSPDNHG